MKTTAKKPYSSRSLVFMKRFRHKLYNTDNQLFFIQSWGLFNDTGIDKERSLKIYSYLSFIMRYQLTSFNIIQDLFITCHVLRIKMRVFVCFLGVFVSNELSSLWLCGFNPPTHFIREFNPTPKLPTGYCCVNGLCFWEFFNPIFKPVNVIRKHR